MSAVSRALWLMEKNQPELRETNLAEPQPGEVVVETLFGAISRGTEALVAAGQVPESEWCRMRAPFQEGDFPFPVKYGYAAVGRIVGGDESRRGETVFSLHPHQDRFVAPGDAAIPVPEDVPPQRAVLAANMETALNIVWDAAILPGDHVAVVGGGLVGLLVASLAAKIPATRTTVVDIDPERAPIVERLGAGFAAPDRAPENCDVVIHASASEAGLRCALAAAGFEARVVEASWYGARDVAVPLGEAFHSRRLSLVASQVGSVAAGRSARWDNRRRLETALSLLADDRLDALISGETRFGELAGRYTAILADAGTLCHLIRYDD